MKTKTKTVKVTKSKASDIPDLKEPFVPQVHTIRGKRAVFDIDAAQLYGITVEDLRDAVANNLERFPVDFMLRLELHEVRATGVSYAFYPEGLSMLAHVLDTPLAVNGAVNMTRAFVMLDRMACGGPLIVG